MAEDVWLPREYALPDGTTIRSLRYSGEEWQIFATSGSGTVLLVKPGLAQKWCACGLLDASRLTEFSFGSALFWCLSSPKQYLLEPVGQGQSPDSKVDALAFALALKESRKLARDVSFHDAIYVERYSRLLPTWTLTPRVDDEVVLGTWLTGGVSISTVSFRRLTKLTGWMSASELAEIISRAGFAVPADAGLLDKNRPIPYAATDGRTEPVTIEGIDSKELSPVSGKSAGGKNFRLPGRPQLESFFNEYVIDIIFNAEKYQALGIDFPSAIVLHGPPGCGKTFAVERLIEFIDWPSYFIDSSSVGSPYIHETSRKISEIFDKAMDDAPSIVVIDEMESFLSDRYAGNSSGLHHVEEVAEFLRRIPEAVKNRVLILAMTNRIDMIDPAILRRGRFDHIIEVGMPSREEAASLLDSLLDKLPKTGELDVEPLLDVLAGKALSDIAFVAREAARLAAKEGKKQLDQFSLEAALAALPRNDGQKNRRIGFTGGAN